MLGICWFVCTVGSVALIKLTHNLIAIFRLLSSESFSANWTNKLLR